MISVVVLMVMEFLVIVVTVSMVTQWLFSAKIISNAGDEYFISFGSTEGSKSLEHHMDS